MQLHSAPLVRVFQVVPARQCSVRTRLEKLVRNEAVVVNHHADHAGASSLFGKDVVRIGHEETRRLLLRDDDPARPAPEETFSDRRTLEIGGERIELAWHGANHTPDNSVIHFPEHDTLMMVDIVNVGWVPRDDRFGRPGFVRP